MPPGGKTLIQQPAELQDTQNINLHQNINQPPEEETEEERAIRLQAEAMRQAREHRESRIRAVRQGCRIVMPEVAFTQEGVSVEGEVFARRSSESISAGKRKMRQSFKRSALYQKEANARLAENGAAVWEADRAKLLEEHPLLESEYMKGQAGRIALFLTGAKEKDDVLLRKVFAEDQEGTARVCVDRFMEMNLNFDLRTDRSFGEASGELEGVAQKTRELERLLKRFPQIRETLTEDQRIDLDTKLEVAQNLSNYYKIRKKIITNARYRSHYNSEISYRYHESDTLEAKNLTMLLWQAESLKNSRSLSPAAEFLARFQEYRETTQDQKEAEETLSAREKLRSGDAEFGKNNAQIEDSRHANYFRELASRADHAVVDRLEQEPHYRVTGEPEAMSESFVRKLANLPRWKAVQHASPEYVRSMVENLARKPQNAQDREEAAECRKANLAGMGQFKELLKKQTDYLKRKYGNGLLLISLEELARHGHEFANDFTNMQGLGAFIDYLKKIPGMFDPEDESDLEMERLFNYYDRCAIAEAGTRSGFLAGSTGIATYSDYKRKIAVATVSDEQSAEAMARLGDAMHLDIRWDTVFDERNIKAEEIPAALGQEDMAEKIRKMSFEDQRMRLWSRLFPETQQMTRSEAAMYFVEKGAQEKIGSMSMEDLSREACLNDDWSPQEFAKAWPALRGALIARKRAAEQWRKDHPGQDDPQIALTGNARREQDARRKYEAAARVNMAGELQRQIRGLAAGLGKQNPELGAFCEAMEEDLLRAQKTYQERLDQMKPQAEPQTQPEAQQPRQRHAARLTRAEAVSSYSDERSLRSREQLAAWSRRLREYLLNDAADAVDAYVNGTRYAVGYTEERRRLIKAMDTVNSTLERTPNVILRQIRDYFAQMTNGALRVPEDAEVLDFSREKPKEAGPVLGGGKRTDALRTFTHWSSQKDTPLFTHEPTVNDLKQRFVSNCYMVAATAGVVNLNPYLLKSCIRDNLDGTVTVRLFRSVERNRPREEANRTNAPADDMDLDGFVMDDDFAVEHVLEPVYVRVSKEIPRIGGADALSSGALWMQMIEKACAFVGRGGATGYRSLWYGEGGDFLERLLGVSPTRVGTNDALFENIRSARERRIIYNAGSKDTVDEKDGLNAGHAYTVMGAEVIAGERYVRLRNPYSTMSLQEEDGTVSRTGRMFDTSSDETYGQFYMKFEDFLKKFQTITYTDLSQL